MVRARSLARNSIKLENECVSSRLSFHIMSFIKPTVRHAARNELTKKFYHVWNIVATHNKIHAYLFRFYVEPFRFDDKKSNKNKKNSNRPVENIVPEKTRTHKNTQTSGAIELRCGVSCKSSRNHYHKEFYSLLTQRALPARSSGNTATVCVHKYLNICKKNYRKVIQKEFEFPDERRKKVIFANPRVASPTLVRVVGAEIAETGSEFNYVRMCTQLLRTQRLTGLLGLKHSLHRRPQKM